MRGSPITVLDAVILSSSLVTLQGLRLAMCCKGSGPELLDACFDLLLIGDAAVQTWWQVWFPSNPNEDLYHPSWVKRLIVSP